MIYCLVRGSNALQRVKESLTTRGFVGVSKDPRIVALTCDLSKPDLGLDPRRFDDLKQQTTLVIHAAWAVNFNLGFEAFDENIKGVHNLIRLSLSVTTPRSHGSCSALQSPLL
jgi:thioester reductase-like protein